MANDVPPVIEAVEGDRVRIYVTNKLPAPTTVHWHGFILPNGQRAPEDRLVKRVTVLVGVGETRDIEFVAEYPGDWAFHCHMTHHIMNQMGHDFPNMIGFNDRGFDGRIRSLLPGYMTMGTAGMMDMTRTGMTIPKNSIPMLKGRGGFNAAISLGGMAGVLKVRDELSDEALANNEDPGWYDHPDGTLARPAVDDELRRDGIET